MKILLLVMVACAQALAADLHGTVTDEKGAPAAGATVCICRVTPKDGKPFEPMYYEDWGKKALTDADGKFTVEKVDAEKRFDVLVVTDGHQAVRLNKLDPAKEAKAKLKAMPEDRKEAGRQIRGKVTGDDGKPVWGAEVTPEGWGSTTRHSYGRMNDVDQITVTNEKGEFVITGKDLDINRDLKIVARGYAILKANLQPPGEDAHEYAMTKGASIKGRLVQEGKALAGAAVQALQTQRNSETFLGVHEVKTDAEGNFVVENLKPDEQYAVAGIGRSLPDGFCTDLQKIKTAGDGETADAGDLQAVPGHTITGKVKLSDGKPLPAGSTIMLSGEERWDTMPAKLEKDGKFIFKGIPNETVNLYSRVKGYKPSAENASFEALNGQGLMGKVDDDIPDLVVLMEPGKPTFNNNAGSNYQALKEQRLQGVSEDAAVTTAPADEKK
jgi:hypothetical protein